MKQLITIIFALLLAVACATTAHSIAVNGENAATTEASLAEIMQPMTERQRLELFAALMAIQFNDVSGVAEARAEGKLETLDFADLSSKIDGLDLEGIYALAEESPTSATIQYED